jgi:hypothetical protein
MLRHRNRPFEVDFLVGALTPLSMCNPPHMELFRINVPDPNVSWNNAVALALPILRDLKGIRIAQTSETKSKSQWRARRDLNS